MYLRYKKKKDVKERIEEKEEEKFAENEEKDGGGGKEVVYRNYIEKYLPTSELIVSTNTRCRMIGERIHTHTYIYRSYRKHVRSV